MYSRPVDPRKHIRNRASIVNRTVPRYANPIQRYVPVPAKREEDLDEMYRALERDFQSTSFGSNDSIANVVSAMLSEVKKK